MKWFMFVVLIGALLVPIGCATIPTHIKGDFELEMDADEEKKEN